MFGTSGLNDISEPLQVRESEHLSFPAPGGHTLRARCLLLSQMSEFCQPSHLGHPLLLGVFHGFDPYQMGLPVSTLLMVLSGFSACSASVFARPPPMGLLMTSPLLQFHRKPILLEQE